VGTSDVQGEEEYALKWQACGLRCENLGDGEWVRKKIDCARGYISASLD